ncbi:DUF1127 domain-containing protein [Nisaea nitritireducens]|uniref:DUF1127 domain-containing protein n=1 Tax=Nisaea nitritireducens TaxID=568392 RepID=UPI001D004B75|nr:DUF1127 domain-containing protein [Nisaea nitritireducens]
MFKNETLNVAPAACMTAGTNGSVFTHKRGRGGVVPAIVTTLLTWQDRLRQRQSLRELGERELSDMGISWAEVEYEVSKPFWIR